MAKHAKPEEPKQSESVVRSKLSEKALRELRDNHQQEYESILTRLCDAAGIPVRRRLTGDAAKLARAQKLAEELGLSLVPAGALGLPE